jgi:L-glutamine-phosphate cytidylyltransferase
VVKKVVILNAGRGMRLHPFTDTVPKCLIEIGGRTILEQQISILYRCGLKEVVIVTGYRENKIRERLRLAALDRNVRYIYNPDFDTSENLVSLWAAKAELSDSDCLILNGDTLIEPDIIRTKCEQAATYPVTLASDSKAVYDADDMKLHLDGDRVVRIGKATCAQNAKGEAIGLSRVSRRGGTLLTAVLDKMVATEKGRQSHYPAAYQMLADMGAVGCSMINTPSWFEIDCPADLELAHRQVAAMQYSPIANVLSD